MGRNLEGKEKGSERKRESEKSGRDSDGKGEQLLLILQRVR